ncbi:FxSxx-COOH system tetratricopeptide repeat protein [Streptomyces sp. NBC_00124]|uniref:FxSxx-COOH system tetratricopeptide repeat protein n=1 Tax=Streptomyces sp. NBC_00124 TaxID=2975662 RepID=UPI00225C1CED|nr:FxSxx-COOH system tetratricopeptide repeat protein [Streptomyces sp. NBC_00124]MCX5360041.1 FxSxx-COOH system tetratricopeptide repeat protein [Streptomyces sp. NBC_00124]
MTGRSTNDGSHEHFTISYAGFNRPWATWIAHQLEQVGHETSLLRWDPPLRMSLVEALLNLLQAPGRVLLVLDDWYFSLGPRSDAEWTEALHEVIPAHVSRFSAVSVATRALPATATPLRPVDLRDLDSREARRRILRRLDIAAPAETATPVGGPAPRFPNDPPSVWNVPRRNVRFTGRDAILEELHAGFERGGHGGARLTLRGISGVGKSQIANEYAHRFGNAYDIVWWVGARFRAPAREQFAQLAPGLELPAGTELGEQIRAVHEALRTGRPYRRWLLILDSADDMEQTEDLLPEGNGHVLITTLTQDWAASGHATEIEVLPFRRPESVAYVRRRAPRLADGEADQLADAVQDLPLLLAQTAAWLDANAMPAKDYIAMIRRGEGSQIGIRISSDYPMGFQTSWSITLNTLQENNPEAIELLHLFAMFSPDAIPVRKLQTARPSDLPDHLAALASDPIRWHTALRRLSESTAVRLDYVETSDTEPAVDRVSMHRLYHGFLVSTLTEERREALSTLACTLLASADPRQPTDTREWTRYAELIPHLETAGALGSPDPVVRGLVLNCIGYMRVRGENRAALKLCEQTLDRWRSRLGPEDSDMLKLIHEHANMLRRSGRLREAEAVGRTILDQLAETRAHDDPDLLRAKYGLGGTLMSLGRYEEAHDMFEECVQAYTQKLGAEAPPTLQNRSNLAVASSLLGRYEESLRLHRDIRLVRERLQPHHQLTLLTGMYSAWMLRLVGRYTDATSHQEQNVRAHRKTMDRYTPQTLLAEHNWAMCMRRNGDLLGAESLMRSVVDRFVEHQGPEHPESLLVRADFATLNREHGNLEQARELAETVAEQYARVVGPHHPYAVGTAGNVALALWEYGERDEVLRITERTLMNMRVAVGTTHPWTLGTGLNAGGARSLAGDEQGAAELTHEVLQSARTVMGEKHPLTLSCKTALASDLRVLRHEQEASKLEHEALQHLSETLGAQHPHTLSIRRRERPYWDFEPLPT